MSTEPAKRVRTVIESLEPRRLLSQTPTVTINDGDVQQSMVNRLTIAYQQPVTLDSGAFEVVKFDGTSVPLNVANPSGDDTAF